MRNKITNHETCKHDRATLRIYVYLFVNMFKGKYKI